MFSSNLTDVVRDWGQTMTSIGYLCLSAMNRDVWLGGNEYLLFGLLSIAESTF